MELEISNSYNIENQVVQEAYAMLTGNINFNINNNQRVLTTLVVTSCNPREGKTSVVINLAIKMAHTGTKVLLVDADLRTRTDAKVLRSGLQLGLSDYLSGKVEFHDAICKTNVVNLTYFSSGNNHSNPIELIYSNRFEQLMDEAKKEYDLVLFDTPAVSSAMDGAFIASKVDATLIVVKMGVTTLSSLRRAKEQIENLNANILGVVLNRVKKRDYKLYFSYYNYFYKRSRFFHKKIMEIDLLPSGNTVEM